MMTLRVDEVILKTCIQYRFLGRSLVFILPECFRPLILKYGVNSKQILFSMFYCNGKYERRAGDKFFWAKNRIV